MEVHMSQILSQSQIDILTEVTNAIGANFANQLSDAVALRLMPDLEKPREKNSGPAPSPSDDGMRTIVVRYSPAGDIEDSDYVLVRTPDEKVTEFDDSVALVLAAAKVLAERIGEVDEYDCGRNLMATLATSYSSLLIKKYLGGVFQ